MGNLFKFLLTLCLLFTGSVRKGLAIIEPKTNSSFSIAALARKPLPAGPIFQKAVPVVRRTSYHKENTFKESFFDVDEEEAEPHKKAAASPVPFIPAAAAVNLRIAQNAFHKPEKLLSLHGRNARAYAGKPAYVLFGVFRI